MLKLDIKDRSRKYGYIYWMSKDDCQVRNMLGDLCTINLVFEKADHGEKNIDWNSRRISIGYRWTQRIPQSKKYFVLQMQSKEKLNVRCI